MTIYYNPAYSAAPYRNQADGGDFGNHYCGDTQLLQRLLFYAGIHYKTAGEDERVACYHANMRQKITPESLFYPSFETDSVGTSRAVLAWRDALVGAGWDMATYQGTSSKLSFIRDMEPEVMPRGEADYWRQLTAIASERRILADGMKVVVTCRSEELKPHIAFVLNEQRAKGVDVSYVPIAATVATGNLGKLQQAILDGSTNPVSFTARDETFRYLRFETDDDAMRYVATQPVDPTAVYFCSNPKRFDNTLKMVGKPTIGSSFMADSPQIVQLFLVGNSLFEYPLNIHRIIAWLNLPISPISRKLRDKLSEALIREGGITKWEKLKEEYLNEFEDADQCRKAAAQYDEFLPLPQNESIDVERVKRFNQRLQKWAGEQLGNTLKSYSEIECEQLAAVRSYCASLVKLLEDAPDDFKYIDLHLWCRNIAQSAGYNQYGAELNAHTLLSTMGDLHDAAEQVVWFTAEDRGVVPYPFDMLTDTEYQEVEDGGAKLCKRDHHTLITQTIAQRLLLNAKRLTIIEAHKCGGESIIRHPLVLQLDQRIAGGIDQWAEQVVIADDHLIDDREIDNRCGDPAMVQLESDVTLKERHERKEKQEEKAESATSLSTLIKHPYTYVCDNYAYIRDQELPSADDLSRTQGNVAHYIIEQVFANRTVKEAIDFYKSSYDEIFEEAVDTVGLQLRLRENFFTCCKMKLTMRRALTRLGEFITINKLTVFACEYTFKQIEWPEAGGNVVLSSRADMVLRDQNDNLVILDFKHTQSEYHNKEVTQNCALQLELYRYIAQKEFGTAQVRVAFVKLPSVDFVTADNFIGVKPVKITKARQNANVMQELANSYRFRWEQLRRGKIERQEGMPIGSGEYGANQAGLFPLVIGTEKSYDINKFDKGHRNIQ